MRKILKEQQKNIRILLLVLYDMAAVFLAQVLALLIRFEFRPALVGREYASHMLEYTPVNIFCCILVCAALQLYSGLWRYAGVHEMFRVMIASFGVMLLQVIGMEVLNLAMPRSYFLAYWMILCLLLAAGRFSYRAFRYLRKELYARRSLKKGQAVPTMVVGAGDAGWLLIRELITSYKVQNRVVCVIDDDVNKIGLKVHGVPIVGNHTRIPEMVEKYGVQEILVAIPSLSGQGKKELYEICKNTGCKLRTLPSMAQLVNNEVSVSMLRNVEIEDLLGREPVKTNLDEVMGYIGGKAVLVTGGGGSIGSELCRQIAGHHPKLLIIFDVYENNAYDIQQELKKKYSESELNMKVLIGSVRNTHRVRQIFETYRPKIVFHAAAHKHVPLMEDSPNEAIKNNVFGTLNVAQAAADYGAERMVLISTDKAVNPTNIMGASKRICEMIIQGMSRRYPRTNFVAVRFGNVLGSNGSVIPLFTRQILAGGPVTVTDKNIIRYFMTIPEAVSLVLQAGAYAKGGEIFVLDMGEPMKIDDLARNLIKLSGLEPDVDIPIVYTGLRPGEKMYEECLKAEEGLAKTANNLIFIGKPIDFDEENLFADLVELKKKAYQDTDEMKGLVKALVPSYQYQEAESGAQKAAQAADGTASGDRPAEEVMARQAAG